MNSLKWRLSFSTGASSNAANNSRNWNCKIFKSIWLDCKFIIDGNDYNFDKSHNINNIDHPGIDSEKRDSILRPALLVIDYLSSHVHLYQDPNILGSIFEDIGDDSVPIFLGLLKIFSMTARIFNVDSTSKLLTILEIMCSFKSSNFFLLEKLSVQNPLIKSLFDALEVASTLSHQLSLMRIIKTVLSAERDIIEALEEKIFDRLFQFFDSQKTKEPQLIQILLSILQRVLAFVLNYSESALLASSASSRRDSDPDGNSHAASPINTGNSYKVLNLSVSSQSNLQRKNVQDVRPVPVTLASRGFNMAFNVVGELIKMAPLSAAGWLSAQSVGESGEKPGEDYVPLSDDAAFAASFVLSTATINEEKLRLEMNRQARPFFQSTLKSSSDDKVPSMTHEPTLLQGEEPLGMSLKMLTEQFLKTKELYSTLFMAIEEAKTPTDALFALQTIEPLLVRSAMAKDEILLLNGYKRISEMVARIEESIVYLTPCRSTVSVTPEPAKTSSSLHGSDNDSIHAWSIEQSALFSAGAFVPSGHANVRIASALSANSLTAASMSGVSAFSEMAGTSLYLSDAGTTFDSYYSTLLASLLYTITSENVSTHSNGVSTPKRSTKPALLLPLLPSRGTLIQNYDALTMLIELLTSTRVSLVMLALRICYSLIKSNSRNAIALEAVGVVTALIKLVATLIWKGNIRIQEHFQQEISPEDGETTVDTNENSFIGDNFKHSLSLLTDIISILQLFSVAFSSNDISVIASVVTIMLHSILNFDESESYSPISNANIQLHKAGEITEAPTATVGLRCDNCESEDAQLECLNESCVHDKFKRLCDECDKVFHKSAAKRTHIRLPILPIRKRYCLQCEDSPDMPVPVWDDATIPPLLDLLGNSAIQALESQKIIVWHRETKRKLLSSRGYDNRRYHKHKDYHYFRQCAIAILCGAVKSLIDDRIVRHQSLPIPVFNALLFCLRGTVIEKLEMLEFNAKSDFKSCSSVDLSSLVENIEPQYYNTPPEAPRHLKNFDRTSSQPPAASNQCPRRIRLMLLIQSIGKFIITSQTYPQMLKEDATNRSVSRRKLGSCLSKIVQFGIHSVMTHLIVDTSRYSNLTFPDKQYSIWMLRECVTLGLQLSSPAVNDILLWMHWLLKCDIIHNGIKLTGAKSDSKAGISQTNAKMEIGSTTHSIHTTATVFPPSSNPCVNLSIRFSVLQELRFLFAGADSSFDALIVDCRLYRIPCLSLSEDGHKSAHSDAPSAETPSENEMLVVGSLPLVSTAAKRALAVNGFTELLVDIVMGKMCSRNVSYLMTSITNRSKPNNSAQQDYFPSGKISELEKEEWFCALAALAQLLCGFDYSKELVDSYIGLKSVFYYFSPIADTISNLAQSDAKRQKIFSYTIDYRSIIVNFIIELCISGGRFTFPTAPYAFSDLKFPMQQSGSSPLEETFSKSFKQTPIKLSYEEIFFQFFFCRDCLPGRKTGVDEYLEKDLLGQGVLKRASTFTSLSPTYFITERTASLVEKCLQAIPALLTFSSLNRGFQIASLKSNAANAGTSINRRSGGGSSVAANSVPFSAGEDNSNSNTMIKRLLTRNISAVSVHSMESDYPWDTDSINGPNSEQRISRGPSGSFTSSHHSLIALSNALKSKVNDTMSNREDIMSEHSFFEQDDANKSISMDLKYRELITAYERLEVSPKNQQNVLLTEDCLSSFFETKKKKNELMHPFPPMLGGIVEGLYEISAIPLIYYPLLSSSPEFMSDMTGFEFQSAKSGLFIFLHHTLMIRSIPFKIPKKLVTGNISSKLDNFEFEVNIDEGENTYENESFLNTDGRSFRQGDLKGALESRDEEEDMFQWQYIFRKHLSILLPPELSKSTSSKRTASDEQIWRPPFSSLLLRSLICGELLLSFAATSSVETQSFILSTLSYLIDGNPANAFIFTNHPATCLSLTRLVPYFGDGLRESAAYLLSQLMRYSTQVTAFDELFRLATKSFQDLESGGKEENKLCKSILFAMGRIAESVGNPTSYMHFDQKSPFKSVLLPKVSLAQFFSSSSITFCSWIRIGSLGSSPTASLAQLHTPFGVVDLYFRVLYKVSTRPCLKNNESESVLSDFSNLPGEFGEGREPLKRSIQLCISFHSNSTSDNQKDLSPHFNDNLKASPDSFRTEEPPLISPDTPFNISTLLSPQKHWKVAVEQLFNSAESASSACYDFESPSVDVLPNPDFDDISKIAAIISRFAIPDAFVEFDWSELGDWHLLAVTFETCKTDSPNGKQRSGNCGIKCSIDGIEQTVFDWTPLGYKNFSAVTSEDQGGIEECTKEPLHRGILNILRTPSSPANLTQEEQLLVSIGGISFEERCYKNLFKNLRVSESSNDFSEKASKYSYIIRCFDSIVCGYFGAVADVALFENTVDSSQLLSCFKEGPTSKFIGIKNLKLSGLNIQGQASGLSTLSHSSEVFGVRTSSFRPISPPPSSVAIASSYFTAAPVSHGLETKISLELQSLRVFDTITARSPSGSKNPMTRINNLALLKEKDAAAQYHQTQSVVSALMSLGGLKALYPMLILDKSRLIAALRVIGCIIQSRESYRIFLSSNVDKVILHCLKSNPNLSSPEVIQVLFEMAMKVESKATESLSEHFSVQSTIETIDKVELVDLIFDLIILFPVPRLADVTLSKTAFDRLREITDEVHDNSNKVLRIGGLFPLLIALSIWNLPSIRDIFPQEVIAPKVISATLVDTRKSLNASPLSGATITSINIGNDSSSRRVTIPAFVEYPANLSWKSGADGEHDRSNRFTRSLRKSESGSRNLLIEAEDGISSRHFLDYYKLQLSCFRLLEQLFKGTSSQTVIQMNKMYNTVSQTATGFTSNHMLTLIGFIVCSSRGCQAKDGSDRESTVPTRGALRRRRRSKRPLQEIFGCATILDSMDMNKENFWMCSAAVVVLDIILDCTNTPMEVCVSNMLRAALTAASMWAVIIELSGSECVEIRERCLRLLILSLSASDDKLDSKQVTGFERMNGFRLLSEQLSSRYDAASESIVEGIFNVMFWNRKSFNKERTNPKMVDDTKESDHHPAEEISRSLLESDANTFSREDSSEPFPPTLSGGIFSKLLWSGNSNFNSAGNRPSPVSEEMLGVVSGASKVDDVASKDNNEAAANESETLPNEIAPATPPRSIALSQSQSKRMFPLSPSKLSPVDKAEIAGEQSSGLGADMAENNAFKQDVPYSIAIPQMFEVLIKVLQCSNSSDLVTDSFQRLEKCITHRTSRALKAVRVADSGRKEGQKLIDNVQINADSIFAQKDWIVWLSDLLATFRHRALNSEDEGEIGSHGGLSCSENESTNESSINADSNDELMIDSGDDSVSHFESGIPSRPSGPCPGGASLSDAVSSADCSSTGTNQKAITWHATKFTGPIFRFINKLLLVDMRSKYSSSRKWQEIFRLSLPESYDVQEVIISNVLDALGTLTATMNNSPEIAMNMLRNVSMLLEQALEKVDLSLVLCLKIVLSLHSLSYNCPPDIRSRIKETCIPEIRKSYIVRCLVDFAQEFYTRALAVVEISSPLEGYLLSADTKPLPNSFVMVIVLHLFTEAFEELDFLLASVDSEAFLANYEENTHHENAANIESYERISFTIELIQSLIDLSQRCVKASIDCKRTVTKLFSRQRPTPSHLTSTVPPVSVSSSTYTSAAISGSADDKDSLLDDFEIVKSVFFNSLDEDSTEQLQDSSSDLRSMSAQYYTTGSNIGNAVSTVSWWGVWSSYQTPLEVPVPPSELDKNSKRSSIYDQGSDPDHLADDAVSLVVPQLSEASEPVQGSSPISGIRRPNNVLSFIRWYSAGEQRHLQSEIKERVCYELRPIIRHCDKIREKFATRFTRCSRLLQDRASRDKASSTKTLRDAQNGCKISTDKLSVQFQKDLNNWISSVKEKLQAGKVTLNSSLQQLPTEESANSGHALNLNVPTQLQELLKNLNNNREKHSETETSAQPELAIQMLSSFFESSRSER